MRRTSFIPLPIFFTRLLMNNALYHDDWRKSKCFLWFIAVEFEETFSFIYSTTLVIVNKHTAGLFFKKKKKPYVFFHYHGKHLHFVRKFQKNILFSFVGEKNISKILMKFEYTYDHGTPFKNTFLEKIVKILRLSIKKPRIKLVIKSSPPRTTTRAFLKFIFFLLSRVDKKRLRNLSKQPIGRF